MHANLLDRAILAIAPGWGAKRLRSRIQAEAFRHAYDAADNNPQRKHARDFGSGNATTGRSAAQIRDEARSLDRNHDIVDGGLNALARNVIGSTGIGVEPQPHDKAGNLVESVAQQLTNLRNEWIRRPEVTRQHSWARASRLGVRAWATDGEMLIQHVLGSAPGLRHASRVPYSVELIEADQLPLSLNDPDLRIMQGIELGIWGDPVAYHMLTQHPGDPNMGLLPRTRRVPVHRVSHVKNVKRLSQMRGVSLLASTITRLEDIKDLEESERVAAKIAACMAAAIIKHADSPHPVMPDGGWPERKMRMQPGMVWDNLRPGETVETINTTRPNPQVTAWRGGQLRAASRGFGVSYSTLSGDYNGTYSSQRQELVENFGAYGVVAWEWIDQAEEPCYRNLCDMARVGQVLDLPAGFPIANLSDALYVPPSMPWINPLHEAEAMETLVNNQFMAPQEVIRRRGARPYDVLDQLAAWMDRLNEWELPAQAKPKASSSAAKRSTQPTTPNPEPAESLPVDEEPANAP